MRSNKYNIATGQRHKSTNYGWFEVLEVINATNVKVKFEKTGFVRKTTIGYIVSGAVKDPYYPSVKGVGFVGEGKYKPKVDGRMTKCHSTWFQIVRRCYDTKCKSFKGYGSKGVVICEEWKNYQNFAEWYYSYYKEGMAIDKDILKRGNKVYGPDYCRFVPIKINNIISDRKDCRGNFPVGVQEVVRKGHPKGVMYIGIMNGGARGIKIRTQTYETPEEDFDSYRVIKLKHIEKVAEDVYSKGEITEDLYKALLNWEIVPFPE